MKYQKNPSYHRTEPGHNENRKHREKTLEPNRHRSYHQLVGHGGRLLSKYPCIHPMSSYQRTQRPGDGEDFAHLGYPHAIVTDNAACFLSTEFQTWCEQRGIQHLHGAPYHPETNGAAERSVQTFKQSLKKSDLPPADALQPASGVPDALPPHAAGEWYQSQ
ncbi:Pol polyprotein [Elysia marginata]|uniref:Pol polyprotein n=1 Tax=Elysia marginata TaxID=1093978 RepID=A0AAV4FPR7_9GAST|nr:Pol polyprotein [Elysia marginata]